MEETIIKQHGEVAKIDYIDQDGEGFITRGFFIESENKGTILKVKEIKNGK